MKILILYASFGGGHLKAAEALKEYYADTYPDAEIMFLDAFKYTSPDLNKILLKSYLQLSKSAPKAWGKIYKYADDYPGITDFATFLSKAVAKRFITLVSDFNPDIILCTHPFAIDMLTLLKNKNEIQSKIGLVITDYASHSLWLSQPETVDAFFVAHNAMIEELSENGINKEKIYPFGIPTLKAVHQEHSKDEIRKDFNLNNNFTILFFPGGEYGISTNINIFKDILRIPNVQIITVAGKNEKLKKQFEKLASISTKNVLILGYSNQIPELLSISDLVVTKPGGLTTSECIVSHTPIVIISPIPGQEEHNSNYILNNGLGFRIFDNSNGLITLKSIISNTKRLEQVKEMQNLLAKPYAAKDICEKMIELI